MYIRSILFGLVCLFSCVSASTLHFIGIADTDDFGLGDAFKRDKKYIDTILPTIAERAGYNYMEFETHWFAGKKATVDRVANFLADPSFRVGEDDTIIFYYAGHGVRTESTKTDFPLLIFDAKNKVIDFQKVIESLQLRHPKLLIAIADCCNSPQEEEYELVPIPEVCVGNTVEEKEEDEYENFYKGYENLFAKSRGQIVITGSSPGNVVTPESLNNLTLALFTTLIHDPWVNPTVTWEELLQKVEKMVKDQSRNSEYPIIQIDLE